MKMRRLLALVLSVLMLGTLISITASPAMASQDVVFLDGTAETNGDGSIDSPFNLITSATAALKNTGGTIVVMGPTSTPGTPSSAKNKLGLTNGAGNTITFTSVYGGNDYRGVLDENQTLTGAYLADFADTSPLSFGAGLGGVNFFDIDVRVHGQYGAFNLEGHPFASEGLRIFEPTTNDPSVETLREATTFQIRPFDISTGSTAVKDEIVSVGLYEGTNLINSLYLGDRGGLTIPGAQIILCSTVNNLIVGDDTKSNSVGGLTIDGDVIVGIGPGGNLKKIALQSVTSSGVTFNGLKAFNGSLVVIVEGGTFNSANISAEVRAAAQKTVVLNEVTDHVAFTDYDRDTKKIKYYNPSGDNFLVIKDGDDTVSYAPIVECFAEAALPASGDYTVDTVTADSYTVSFAGCDLEALVVPDFASSIPAELPVLESEEASFLGWALSADAAAPDFAAGTGVLVTGDMELYPVWTMEDVYTNTFYDKDGNVLAAFTGPEGTPVTDIPEAPFVSGYEFKWWDDGSGLYYGVIHDHDVDYYAVYEEDDRNIVFLNGEKTANGNGLTPDTPFNSMAKATEAVKNGGTVVVLGKTAFENSSLKYNGDIEFTSVYGGKDYRKGFHGANGFDDLEADGAYLIWSTASPYSASSYGTGRIIFNDMALVFRSQYSGFNANGHPVEVNGTDIYEPIENKNTCETFRAATTFSVRAYATTQDGSTASDTNSHYAAFGRGTTLNAYYFGDRIDRTTGGYTVSVGGTLNNLYISNDIKKAEQGQLTVNGSVYVNVDAGGTVKKITTQAADAKSGLAAFNGDLLVAVGPGGSVQNIDGSALPAGEDNITAVVKVADDEWGSVECTGFGRYFLVNYFGVEGATDAIVTGDEGSFNVPLLDGEGIFEISESGAYEITFQSIEYVEVDYTDSLCGDTGTDFCEAGTVITLPECEFYEEGYQFAGWATPEGGLLPAGAEYTVGEERIMFTTVWVAIETLEGASVRMIDPTGLRFTTDIEADSFANLGYVADSVTFGTIIAPADYITDEFTMEAFDNEGKAYLNIVNEAFSETNDVYCEFKSVISNIKNANYTRAFAGRGYIRFTYSDGTEGILYSAFDTSANCRSVAEVAHSALLDASASYTDAQRAVLEGFAAAYAN